MILFTQRYKRKKNWKTQENEQKYQAIELKEMWEDEEREKTKLRDESHK